MTKKWKEQQKPKMIDLERLSEQIADLHAVLTAPSLWESNSKIHQNWAIRHDEVDLPRRQRDLYSAQCGYLRHQWEYIGRSQVTQPTFRCANCAATLVINQPGCYTFTTAEGKHKPEEESGFVEANE